MAGFGAPSGNKKSKKKSSSATPIKLKPKLQWDRYLAMKESTIITVAVQKINNDGDTTDDGWTDVGYVRSLNDELIDVAVARQRALIAEHAKRLFPLQVSKM